MHLLLALREEGDLEVTKQERLEKLQQLLDRYPARKGHLLEVGEFTYGQPIVRRWDDKTKLKIGKFCSIGSNVQIFLGGEHHTEWLTTYPFDVLLGEGQTKSKGDVTIGNDVWIGNDVTILSGVTIGDGAVIGAGSVVTKNVKKYQIVGGAPVRQIRFRFFWYEMKRLDALKWWDWPIEEIAEKMPMLLAEPPAKWEDDFYE